jgi:hypothetical protein
MWFTNRIVKLRRMQEFLWCGNGKEKEKQLVT